MVFFCTVQILPRVGLSGYVQVRCGSDWEFCVCNGVVGIQADYKGERGGGTVDKGVRWN